AVQKRLPTAIGVAIPKREAWILVALPPLSPDEAARRGALGLSFDPCVNAHQLWGRRGGERNAKTVLAAILEGDHARENDAVAMRLDQLRARGGLVGLAEFLDELAQHIRPFMAGDARRAPR